MCKFFFLGLRCVFSWCLVQAYTLASTGWPTFHGQDGSTLSTPVPIKRHNVSNRSVPLQIDLGPTWHELDQVTLNKLIVTGLRVWTANVEASPQRVQAWSASLRTKAAALLKNRRWPDFVDDLIQAAAKVGCLLEAGTVEHAHLAGLHVLTRGLADWILPPGAHTKRPSNLQTDASFFALGAMKLLLKTRWQALRGKRRRTRALARCKCLPPTMHEAMVAACGCWNFQMFEDVSLFICWQVFGLLSSTPQHAVLYMMSNGFYDYLGSTKYDLTKSRSQAASPMTRCYQHLQEHRKALLRKEPVVNQKVRLFKAVHAADTMFWILCTGEETYIRTLETASISCWQPKANTSAVGRCHSTCRAKTRCRPRHRIRKAHTADCIQAQQEHLGRVATRRQAPSPLPFCLNRSLLKLPYRDAYTLACRSLLLEGVGFGPVDIGSDKFQTLLVRYVADAQHVCWDSLCNRFQSRVSHAGEMAIVVGLALRKLPSTTATNRCRKRLDHKLRQFGERTCRRTYVPWPPNVPTSVFHRSISDILRGAPCSLSQKWCLLNHSPVLGTTAKHCDCWRYKSVAKDICDEQLLSCPLQVLKPCKEDCRHMRRIKLHWGVPLGPKPEKDSADALKALRSTVKRAGLKFTRDMRRHIQGFFAASVHPAREPLELQYDACFPLRAPTQVHVQEDKDRNAAWVLPKRLYERWCVFMFRQDNDHWLPVNAQVEDIVEEYRCLHEQCLPQHLRHYAKKSRWAHYSLPYAYTTLKQKCFQSGTGQTCRKPGHSCFRRIIAWTTHPAKSLYRGAARAISGMITALGAGFETANLHTAIPDLRRAVGKLRRSSTPHVCTRCSNSKPQICVRVLDAAQMYEELPVDRVLLAAQEFQKTLQENSDAVGIAVTRTRRLHTWLSKSTRNFNQRAQVWHWPDILKVLTLALSQPTVRLGKFLFKQVRGVPIGGHCSKAIASLVLAHDEVNWVKNKLTQGQLGFLPDETWDFHEVAAFVRYVDDVATASKVLCDDCLVDLVDAIYTPPIKFEAAKSDKLGVPFLDVWLMPENDDIRVRADLVEAEWRDHAGENAPSKFRLKPWRGFCSFDVREARGLVASKLVRLKSLHLSQDELQKAVAAELQLWVLSGYPRQVIAKLWAHAHHFPPASKCARDLLHAWDTQSHLPDRVMSYWEM